MLAACASLVNLNLASCSCLRDSGLQSLAVPTAGGSLKGDDVAVRLLSSLLPEGAPVFGCSGGGWWWEGVLRVTLQ